MKLETKNKGGRPRTDRNTAVTIRLSDEALAVLNDQPNKTAFIDALIRGEVEQVECPHCGKTFTIKTEE
jgi:uncharacterized Zn-finger protein